MLWRIAWPYLRQHFGRLTAVIVLQFVATMSALMLPDLNATIIDQGVVPGDVGRVWQLGFVMIGVSALQAIAAGFAVYLAASLAMGLGRYLRGSVFDRIQTFSLREVHMLGAPSLITRSTNDVQQIQMVTLMILNFMISAPIMAVGGVIMALRMNVKLSGLLLVVIPIIGVVVGIAFVVLSPLFRSQQDRLDRMNTVLREELSGIRVIRAFVRQDDFDRRYTGANNALRDVALKIGAVFAVIFPLLQLVFSAATVAVIWFGGHLIESGEMQIGALLAFVSYLAMIFMATMMASMLFFMLPRAEVTSRRVNEVFTVESTITAPPPNQQVQVPSGPLTFTFDHVCVKYPGAEEPVLEGIDAQLSPGTTTAVIGSTGSGKSTFASLLPRLLDPSAGQVTVNGVNVKEFDPDSLRKRIGFVPQDAYLFSGTIASTVSGVPDPTEKQKERVTAALDAAAATEFVANLDDGLDHEVESGGANFSGGQRQRLTMARALYRDADLYVFDDSFSALDYATDAQIRQSLRGYVGDAAVLIVAQRVATIRHVDTILVLSEDGSIVGRGTHQELMETSETYRQIVASQLTEEESR